MEALFGCLHTQNLTAAILVATVIIIIVYMYRHFTQMRRYGFQGPTPWPLLGNLAQMFKLGHRDAFATWEDKYGKVFGLYHGFTPTVYVSDPEILKNVMVKEFHKFMDRPNALILPKLFTDGLFFLTGRKWKRTRNIVTPAFSSGKMKHFVPILNKCAETLVEHVSKHTDKDVEIRPFFIHFTMDAIASTVFGIDVDSQNQPDDPFVSNIDNILDFSKLSRKALLLLTMSVPGTGALLGKLGIHSFPQKSVEFYRKTGQMLIDERKEKKMSRIDFIQMLLEARFNSSKSEYIHNGFNMNAIDNNNVQRLTDDDINGQAFLFFLAGYETTASLLRFASYVLATHPDIDTKLYEEIMEHIGDEEPTYENLATLTYMDMFIDELLRFYPPLPRINRVAIEDVVIEGKHVPKGSIIIIPVYLIHHNPQYFPDPEVFDPTRFATENKMSSFNEGTTYMPFGTGPRHCVGMRLALVEAKIALVHLLRKVKFVQCAKTQIPLDLKHIDLLRPTTPVCVRVQQR